MILNSPTISGSLTVTGNTILSGSITSLAGIAGTASYATNANLLDGLDSTSFATTSSNVFKASQTITGSLNVSGNTITAGTLSSTKYTLGSDLSLIPVSGNQSVITTWWGLQLVGNKQSAVDYTPTAIGANSDFSIIIPNQQATKIGLIVKGQTSQTGNLLEFRDINNTGWSAFNNSGSLSLGKTTSNAILDINGNALVTGSLTATGTITAQTLVVQTITSSVDFVTGSARFGSNTGNTHQFTGSVLVSGSQTINGTLNGVAATFSGLITGQAGILLSTTQAINTAGSIGYNSTQGIFIYTKAGSAYDFKLYNGVGSTTIQIPTGTQNVEFLGTASFAGSVGIGLTSPQSQLHMNGVLTFTESGYDTARLHTITHAHSAGNNPNNYIAFNVSDGSGTTAERMRINGAGNVGIGTTSPSAQTEIRVNTNDYGNNLLLSNTYPASGIATSISFGHNTQAADPDIMARISGYVDDRTSGNRLGSLRFYTGNAGTVSERMRITSTGNLELKNTNTNTQFVITNTSTASSTSKNTLIQFQGTDTTGTIKDSGAIQVTPGGVNYIDTSMLFYTRGGDAQNPRMTITGGGNIGIGMTSPSYRLDVNRGSSGVVLNLDGENAYNAETGILISSGRAKISGFLNSSGGTPGTSLRFYTMPDGGSVTERIRIDSNGNVGIGTSAPALALDVIGRIRNTFTSSGTTVFESYNPSATGYGAYISGGVSTNYALQVADYANNVRLTILGNGNVGIGTTSPGARLQVKASAAAGATDAFYIENSAGTGLFSVRDDGLTYLKGNVGINTATPSVRLEVNGNYKLFGGSTYTSYTGDGLWNAAATPNFIGTNGQGSTYNRYTGINGGILLGYQDNGSGLYSPAYGFEVKSTDGRPVTGNVVKAIVIKDTDTDVLVFYVNNNGNVLNVNNSYGSTSDISLKENIVDATPKLNDLLNVKIRNYNLKADPNQTKQIGVIAQELEEIFPGMIETDTEGIKSVKYSVFVPMLIKSIQELKAELNISNQKIAALESAQ
jgi:hypothetical protein